ncbi:anti-sigma factor [Lentzea sp.]|uniref:anti-sigma factor n=1 Tax=Lentzea sp. TaxID=56099 RepID=UPI002ED011BF
MLLGRTREANPHLATGAHALGALPGEERDEFEAHLDRCRGCAEELSGLQETAARLAGADVRVAPDALRPQVLQAVHHLRQVPPVTEVGTAISRRQGLLRAAALVSAACVAAAAVAGVHGAVTATRISPAIAPAHTRIGDLLAAPDLRLVTSAQAGGTAAVSSSRHEILFLADGLRSLPGDRVYQLWLVDGDGPRSAGTMRPAGATTSLLVPATDDVEEVVLTVEPVHGSPSPTSAPVVTIALA